MVEDYQQKSIEKQVEINRLRNIKHNLTHNILHYEDWGYDSLNSACEAIDNKIKDIENRRW